MKYLNTSLLVTTIILLLSVNSFGWDQTGSGTITCGDTTDETLDIALSPGVTAGYGVADWLGVNDWYVVGTYHEGGSKTYATASSLTKLWSQEIGAGETVVTAFEGTPDTPDEAASDNQWSEGGWDI
jgi:hypothetical protein